MLVVRIIKCETNMWYKDLIGCYVPFGGFESASYYWSIEKTGYKNIVKTSDAELEEVTSVEYYTPSKNSLEPVNRNE